MTLPLETDFDLADDRLADSLKRILELSVSDAVAAGGEPVRIVTERTWSAVWVSVLVRDPLPDGSTSVLSFHFLCVSCRTFRCLEHSPRA